MSKFFGLGLGLGLKDFLNVFGSIESSRAESIPRTCHC
jgi:hypothetical protein